MADEPDNLVLVYLRRIDEHLAGLEREFTLRMTGVEARMASLEARFADLEVRVAALEARLDTINHRLDRIERRVDLVDTPFENEQAVADRGRLRVLCRVRAAG